MKYQIVIIALMLINAAGLPAQEHPTGEQLIPMLQQQIENNPDDAYLHFKLGKLLFQQASSGDKTALGQAKKEFKTVLKLQPDHAAALCWQGCLTVIQARYAWFPPMKGYYVIAGLEKMDKAVSMAPNLVECRYIRGQTCLQIPDFFNRLDTAVKDYSKLDTLAQQSIEAFGREEHADILYTLGTIYERQKKWDLADHYFDRIKSDYAQTASAGILNEKIKGDD